MIADFAFDLCGEGAELQSFARRLYSSAGVHPIKSVPPIRYHLSKSRQRYVLSCGGEEVCRSSNIASFFQKAEWALTKAAMIGLDRYFQVHAGAVASADGRARLIVGPPDSGKTSLVLAFAQAGEQILSDEIALIRDREFTITPFPRDLVVHDGTCRAFTRMLEAADEPPWKTFERYRFIAPAELGSSPHDDTPISQLVFPSRRPGKGMAVESVGQAGAAELLLEQAFNLSGWGARGVELTAKLVERCSACVVRFDDARTAIRELPRL